MYVSLARPELLELNCRERRSGRYRKAPDLQLPRLSNLEVISTIKQLLGNPEANDRCLLKCQKIPQS